MTLSNAIFARGTLLKKGDGGSPTETFTTIAEVMKIKGPGLIQDTIDVTNHDSAGSWKEFIAGLKDAGEVTFTVNYQPTNATHNATSTGLVADLTAGTKRNFQLVFNPGSPTWAFTALVSKFDVIANENDRYTADVTLRVTGQPTLA